MSMMRPGEYGLDIELCRYGYSQLNFRGPPADLDAPYIAFLGSLETVAPFLRRPFPVLVANAVGYGCANLGIKNAGCDVYLQDPEVLRVAQAAVAVVIEPPSPANLSNVYYKVHPRRNDRVVRVNEALFQAAPRLDATEIHFTGHLFREVQRLSPATAADMRAEVQSRWVDRMTAILTALAPPVTLVHFAGTQPLLTHEMLALIDPYVHQTIEITPSPAAQMEGISEMVFDLDEIAKARQMQSAQAHEEAAATLISALQLDMKKARAG